MNLVRAKSWGLKKPPPGTPINWAHPLAEDLVVCIPLNEGAGRPVELVRGVAADSFTATWSCRGMELDGSAGYASWSNGLIPDNIFTGDTGFTVWWLGGADTNVTGNVFVSKQTGTSNRQVFLLDQKNPAGELRTPIFYISTQGDSLLLGTTGPRYAASTLFSLSATMTRLRAVDSSRIIVAINGKPIIDTTNPSIAARTGEGAPFTIGAKNTTPTGFMAGWCSAVYSWRRALNRDELLSLEAQPYAMFGSPGAAVSYFDLAPAPPENRVTTGSLVLHSS